MCTETYTSREEKIVEKLILAENVLPDTINTKLELLRVVGIDLLGWTSVIATDPTMDIHSNADESLYKLETINHITNTADNFSFYYIMLEGKEVGRVIVEEGLSFGTLVVISNYSVIFADAINDIVLNYILNRYKNVVIPFAMYDEFKSVHTNDKYMVSPNGISQVVLFKNKMVALFNISLKEQK